MNATLAPGTSALRLCLYVAGDSPNSVAAERNLRRLLASYPTLTAELEIRDVLIDPEAGLRARVIATPTLLKVAPEPERRVLGDLHDLDLLRDVLGLHDTQETSAE